MGFIALTSIYTSRHHVTSLYIVSTGSISYIPTNVTHSLFNLTKLYRPWVNSILTKNRLSVLSSKFFIQQTIFFIRHLPRNFHISMLELRPGSGIKYVRSPGTSGWMSKLDVSTNLAIIRLPSGVKKVFSGFSLGSPGKTLSSDNRYWSSNKAGFYSKLGRKPIVRGVARNPIDHPHGGRTKSIKYPRTPWGKTTKFK